MSFIIAAALWTSFPSENGGVVPSDHDLKVVASALYGRTSWSDGQASPLNFDNYRMLRMRDMPVISVQIVATTAPPTGTGEPGVPPIAPAVVNAYRRLTGIRLRTLPLLGG